MRCSVGDREGCINNVGFLTSSIGLLSVADQLQNNGEPDDDGMPTTASHVRSFYSYLFNSTKHLYREVLCCWAVTFHVLHFMFV